MKARAYLTEEFTSLPRSMGDKDGPFVAKEVYAELLQEPTLKPDDIPYALDAAVRKLRATGVPPSRWATFIHMGA
jgi:hypothetical protein